MTIQRSRYDRMIAGVCGGLAEHLGWSPFRVRTVWVLVTIFTAFAGVLVYLALWFLMPVEPRKKIFSQSDF
jgi:phage shock protein C